MPDNEDEIFTPLMLKIVAVTTPNGSEKGKKTLKLRKYYRDSVILKDNKVDLSNDNDFVQFSSKDAVSSSL